MPVIQQKTMQEEPRLKASLDYRVRLRKVRLGERSVLGQTGDRADLRYKIVGAVCVCLCLCLTLVFNTNPFQSPNTR